MKRLLLTVMFIGLWTFANGQETSLTIDNQIPGWLSSKIEYANQQTLRNIKITGYINGTDIKFLRELNLNRNLRGIIDLEDANILSGGDSYGPINIPGRNPSPTTKDNTITEYMFACLNSIQKVILPKSTTEFTNNGFQFLSTRVDTLIINGNMESINVGSAFGSYSWGTKCIYFPEGITEINLAHPQKYVCKKIEDDEKNL